jgi:hypothetical protein
MERDRKWKKKMNDDYPIPREIKWITREEAEKLFPNFGTSPVKDSYFVFSCGICMKPIDNSGKLNVKCDCNV